MKRIFNFFKKKTKPEPLTGFLSKDYINNVEYAPSVIQEIIKDNSTSSREFINNYIPLKSVISTFVAETSNEKVTTNIDDVVVHQHYVRPTLNVIVLYPNLPSVGTIKTKDAVWDYIYKVLKPYSIIQKSLGICRALNKKYLDIDVRVQPYDVSNITNLEYGTDEFTEFIGSLTTKETTDTKKYWTNLYSTLRPKSMEDFKYTLAKSIKNIDGIVGKISSNNTIVPDGIISCCYKEDGKTVIETCLYCDGTSSINTKDDLRIIMPMVDSYISSVFYKEGEKHVSRALNNISNVFGVKPDVFHLHYISSYRWAPEYVKAILLGNEDIKTNKEDFRFHITDSILIY